MREDKKLDEEFWNNRYLSSNTQWDLSVVSPPLKNYIDQIENKNVKILIPGCGNAYEAEYLLQHGFDNITVIDIAPKLVESLQIKFKREPRITILLGDFFELNQKFDLIIEQTFFCALPIKLRQQYAEKINQLLNKNGKLVGLLFNREFETEGPPFGGSKEEYMDYFKPYFSFKYFDDCYNSFHKRYGTELFINLIKK